MLQRRLLRWLLPLRVMLMRLRLRLRQRRLLKAMPTLLRLLLLRR